MKTVTLFHSILCPRCAVTRVLLKRVLADFPNIRLEQKELLSHQDEAKRAGAKTIPALVAGDRILWGVILMPASIRLLLAGL